MRRLPCLSYSQLMRRLKGRPVRERNAEQVDVQVDPRVLEQREHLARRDRVPAMADGDDGRQRAVVALRVHDADLVDLRDQPLTTGRNISGAWVKDQKVEVTDGRISAYQVVLEVTFVLE